MKWFEKEQKTLTKGVDFDLIDTRNSDDAIIRTSVKILSGKYKDIVYHYGKVGIKENSDAPIVKYQYVITKEGKFDVKKLHTDKKFIKLMGDILVEIFDKHLDLNSMKENDDPTGINDTEESHLQ